MLRWRWKRKWDRLRSDYDHDGKEDTPHILSLTRFATHLQMKCSRVWVTLQLCSTISVGWWCRQLLFLLFLLLCRRLSQHRDDDDGSGLMRGERRITTAGTNELGQHVRSRLEYACNHLVIATNKWMVRLEDREDNNWEDIDNSIMWKTHTHTQNVHYFHPLSSTSRTHTRCPLFPPKTVWALIPRFVWVVILILVFANLPSARLEATHSNGNQRQRQHRQQPCRTL